MRYLLYLLLFTFLVNCTPSKQLVRAPENITRCLKTVLVPTADNGGTWTVIDQPELSLPLTLTGDNPCVNLALYGCGQYIFRYTVESTTCDGCIKESNHTINYSLTIVGTSSCL